MSENANHKYDNSNLITIRVLFYCNATIKLCYIAVAFPVYNLNTRFHLSSSPSDLSIFASGGCMKPSILVILIIALLLSGCTVTNNVTITTTPTVHATNLPFPVATNTVQATTATPPLSPTVQPTIIPVMPTANSPALPLAGETITQANANRLTLLDQYGKGNPVSLDYTIDGNQLIVGTSLGLYLLDPQTLAVNDFLPVQHPVEGIALHPDGQTVAVRTESQILFLNLTSGELLKVIDMRTDKIEFSADGTNLFVSEYDRNNKFFVTVINVSTYESTAIISHEYDYYWSFDLSPTQNIIAMAGSLLSLYETDGTLINEYWWGPFTIAVTFSKDGNLLAELREDRLTIYQVLENNRILSTRQFSLPSWSIGGPMSIAPNSKYIALATIEGIYVWELSSGLLILKQAELGNYYTDIVWSPDSKYLFTVSRQYGIQRWDVLENELTSNLFDLAGIHTALAWSPDGKTLAVGTDSGQIYQIETDSDCIQQLSGIANSSEIVDLAFSPQDNTLAIGYSGDPDGVQIRDQNGTVLRTFETPSSCHQNVAYSQSGDLFATCITADDPSSAALATFETHTWSIVNSVSLNSGARIREFSVNPGIQVGAIVHDGNTIVPFAVIDPISIELPDHDYTHGGTSIGHASFSPDYSLFASIISETRDYSTPRLIMRSTTTWKVLFDVNLYVAETNTFNRHSMHVPVSWTTDSKLLAIGFGDGSIKLVNPLDGEVIASLSGHSMYVADLAFSPDGTRLASVSDDGTIYIWGIQ